MPVCIDDETGLCCKMAAFMLQRSPVRVAKRAGFNKFVGAKRAGFCCKMAAFVLQNSPDRVANRAGFCCKMAAFVLQNCFLNSRHSSKKQLFAIVLKAIMRHYIRC